MLTSPDNTSSGHCKSGWGTPESHAIKIGFIGSIDIELTPYSPHATAEDERGINWVSLENDVKICIEVVILVLRGRFVS
jgi:hypothetical protein